LKGRCPAKKKQPVGATKRRAKSSLKKQLPEKNAPSNDADNTSRRDTQPVDDESVSANTEIVNSTAPGADMEPNAAPKQYNTRLTNDLHPGYMAGLARRYQSDISKIAAEK
jgi:hypothetical protein